MGTKDDKTETFVTKITEDKDGNKNVYEISPDNYSDEVKAIYDKMDETDCVIQEVTPFEAIEDKKNDEKNEEDKMIEEDCKMSDLSSGSGNLLFSSMKF